MVRLEVQRLDGEHEVVGYGPHLHEFFEVLVFETGGGVQVVEGAVMPVTRGQVWLLRPGVSHDLAGLGKARGWIIIAGPDALGLAPWDDRASAWPANPLLAAFHHVEPSGSPIPLRLSPSRLRRWLQRLAEIDDEVRTGRFGYQHAARALLQLLLLDAARSVPPPAGAAVHPLVERALELVDAGFRGPLSLADIARALAVTPGHLTEVTRKRTGRPLGDWILQRRMVEARTLLGETALPVAEVAAACGFSDVGHFGRQFRRVHGRSPLQWRAAVTRPVGETSR